MTATRFLQLLTESLLFLWHPACLTVLSDLLLPGHTFFFAAITSASAFSIFSSNACYQGYSLLNDKNERVKFTFAEVEKAYYVEKYSDYVDGQNEKNRKARYYDRVKTIDGILENNKMCPEETLLQLENIDGTVLADVLAQISAEYSFQTIAGCSYNN